jgi:AcrR family transcriptional regulator
MSFGRTLGVLKIIFINYKTVMEKAEEWSVTPRHIQYLCREGKIKNVVKRAGAWFIPDDAPNPMKYMKPDYKTFRFIGTKQKIFTNAIKLFTERGYENVTINDIAKTCDIRQSAVYNHFKTKEELLNTIYDFFRYYHKSNRPSLSDVEGMFKSCDLLDVILSGFLYAYGEDVVEQMSDIVKIIFQRVLTDKKANEIYTELILEDGIRFVEDGLKIAVDMGRIRALDTRTLSLLIHCTRLYTFLWWIANPPSAVHEKMINEHIEMYKHIVMLITDLKPLSQ